jgi:hypothetical protein
MKENTILNKVREILGMEVKLEQRKLDDKVTVIEAESFEQGEEVMIITEDEQKIALPIGEYKMESGEILVVAEEGIISELKEAEEEVVEEEVKEEVIEEEVEAATEESKPIKKTVESIVKETFFSDMEKLKKENEELKSQLQELSKEEVKETESETITEEVNEEVELSAEEPKAEVEAAAEPIVHNPENKAKKVGNTISPNKRKTIMDTVLSKIANSNTNNN